MGLPGTLREALGVAEGEVVAFIGAGGKTTALRRLAAEASAAGRRVVLVSTTKIEPQAGDVETVLAADLGVAEEAIRRQQGGAPPLLIVTERLPARWRGVPTEWVDRFAAMPEVGQLLIQADGAARRPFKAPAPYEPVLPRCTECVVMVMGVDAIGRPIDARHVHRPEIVAEFAGVAMAATLTAEVAARVLLHPRGGFRNAPAHRAILINKVESAADLERATAVALAVRERVKIRVVAAALRAAEAIRAVWE